MVIHESPEQGEAKSTGSTQWLVFVRAVRAVILIGALTGGFLSIVLMVVNWGVNGRFGGVNGYYDFDLYLIGPVLVFVVFCAIAGFAYGVCCALPLAVVLALASPLLAGRRVWSRVVVTAVIAIAPVASLLLPWGPSLLDWGLDFATGLDVPDPELFVVAVSLLVVVPMSWWLGPAVIDGKRPRKDPTPPLTPPGDVV